MLLRKSRKHLHGASNRNLLHPNFCTTFYKPTPEHPKNNLTTDTHPASSHAPTRPRKQHPLRNSLDNADPPQDSQGRLEQQLRKMYQGRKNIAKTIQGWGFDASGFISSSDFGERVQEKVGVQVQEGEVQQLLRKYCRSSERIDTKQLISLIHGRTEGSLFNETLFPAGEQSKQRDAKINNLKESLKAYQSASKTDMDSTGIDKFLFKVNSAISKLKQQTDCILPNQKQQFFAQLGELGNYGETQKQVLNRIAEVVDYEEVRYNIQSHISVDQLFLDPILRKTRPIRPPPPRHQQAQNDELFINKMAKSSTSPLRTLTNFEKRQDLDPKAYFHINQQKTRFGLSKFSQESEEKCFIPKENVSANQKDLILQTIKSQADIHRQRYENKLTKLRALQRAQGQSIARRQQDTHERDQRKLQRIRHEQQAYNYVNFIKKRWE